DRLIAQLRVFEQARYRVDTETRDPAIEPELDHTIHRLLDLRIAPIQVRLLHIKIVVVVLVRLRVDLPGRAAEPGEPIVRWAPVLSIAPDIPVALGIRPRTARLFEPRVLVRGVIRDKIHDHAD